MYAAAVLIVVLAVIAAAIFVVRFPPREGFAVDLNSAGEQVVDSRCSVTTADGAPYVMAAFDGARAVDRTDRAASCYVMDGAGDGLMDAARAACSANGAFWDSSVVSSIGVGAAMGESHCVLAMKPGLPASAYAKYEAGMRDATVLRSAVFAGQVAELDAVALSMGSCGADLRAANAETAALVKARADADALTVVTQGERQAATALGDQCAAALVASRAEAVATSEAKTLECAASTTAKQAGIVAGCDAKLGKGVDDCGASVQAQKSDYENRIVAMRRDCEVGPWDACDKACGPGRQKRRITVTPTAGGSPCPVLEQACQAKPCPVDCVLDAWGPCSASCGPGQQTRSVRTNAVHGGKECDARTRACNERPCPVNCAMNGWSGWSACSASCGYGEVRRSRTVAVHPANGGAGCPATSETAQCHAGSCTPPPPPSRYVRSRNRGNFCVDVQGISRDSGAQVYMWDCWNGPNQRWQLDGKQRLVNENSGMCLDVWGGNPNEGAEVKQYPCHDGANQRWVNNGGMLQPAHAPGKCLDIWGGATGNGSRLSIYPCHGGPNQRFDFGP
jgi:hypothetical protein